ncbi:MAG: hypothetical protein ACOYX1_17025 [Acidobacteriota bacterium]
MKRTRLPLLLLLLLTGALAPAAPAQLRRTVNPHGPLRTACESCHTASGWRPVRPHLEFDHNTQTAYPLRGRHEGVACNACHVDLVFRRAPQECAACHADVHRRQLGPNCAQCHTVQGFTRAVRETREHFNRFPLLGAHSAAPCESCHKSAAAGIFAGLSTECAACHQTDYNRAALPPHGASRFPLDCRQCHQMNSWRGARFDHQSITGFALTGAHTGLECLTCHTGGRFQGTPADCFSCHARDFAATQSPNHAAAGFPRECSQCHTTAQWKGAVFDHAARTRFVLTGAHAQAQCSACHAGGRFSGTPQNCDGCHLTQYRETVNPNHAASNFPLACQNCHTTTQWKGASFDHSLSRFALTGAHMQAQCASCHKNGVYTGTPTACEGCHLTQYNQASNPNHAAAGFPKDCAVCHTTAQWKGAVFDHNRTQFALTGAHTQAQCASCHKNGVYRGTPMACEGCHLTQYNQASNPSHAAAGFPKDCAVCHTTAQWKGARFDHAAMTRFPLTGAHVQVQCASCHKNGVYRGTPTACEGCHLTQYNQASNPNHAASGFPTDCAVCHTTLQWKGARFDHTAMTRFPLTGAHVQVQCASCHKNGVYRGTPTACEGCHLTQYNQTSNPNHAAAGFPTDCAACHNTTRWQGAVFDHNRTRFALTGAHTRVACANCHVGGRYSGTPTDCYSCHRAVYERVSNPNHIAAGFPKDCTLCHTTAAWSGARFNHRFPIYTGAHAGKWSTCNDCHTVPSNYASFSCLNCHAHNKTDMDRKHQGRPNYVYASPACYQCHPQGKG